MGTPDAPQASTGLTLPEAEARIHALEAVAVKAALVLAETVKAHQADRQLATKLISCVELLFDELRLERLRHSEFVEESLGRVATAVKELKQGIRK
jgi:hypothetical protein